MSAATDHQDIGVPRGLGEHAPEAAGHDVGRDRHVGVLAAGVGNCLGQDVLGAPAFAFGPSPASCAASVAAQSSVVTACTVPPRVCAS